MKQEKDLENIISKLIIKVSIDDRHLLLLHLQYLQYLV